MKRVHTGVALVLLALSVSLFLSGASLARHLSDKASLPGFTGTVQCVFVDPGNGWVYAGTEGGAGVYRSTDNGANWDAYGTGLGTKDVLAIVKRGTDILAGTWGEGIYQIAVSGGTSWTQLGSLPSTEDSIRSMAVGSDYTYAAESRGRVWELASGSSTWEEIDRLLPSDSAQRTKFIFVDTDDKLYGGVTSLGVYEYDGGWQSMGDLGGRHAQAMDYGPDGNLWVGTSDGVHRWSGTAWVPVWGAGKNVTALKRNPQDTDELAVGTNSGEVWCYRGSTGQWNQINMGITGGQQVWSLAFGTSQPLRLFAGAGDGLYYADSLCPTATPTNTPTTTPTPIPDLALTLSNDPRASVPVSGGDYITYTVHYTNVGPTTLTGVLVWCYIPDGNVQFDATDGTGQYVADPTEGDRVEWDVETVGPGVSGDLWFRVQVEPIPPTPTPTATSTPTATNTPTATYTPSPIPTVPGQGAVGASGGLPGASEQITNEGAYATWNGQSEPIRSNPVYNWIGGQPKIYLPLVMKNHG